MTVTQTERPIDRLFDKLRALLAEQWAEDKPIDTFVFTLTREDETAIAWAAIGCDALPGGLQAAVLLQGPRATFTQIFGVHVEWDAKETGVRELV